VLLDQPCLDAARTFDLLYLERERFSVAGKHASERKEYRQEPSCMRAARRPV
jgi:hypothetical protein